MLRVSLTETYEAQSREKDSDLIVLRREMLDAVTTFSSDKQQWEQALEQKEEELLEVKVKKLSIPSIFNGHNNIVTTPPFVIFI